MVNVEKYTKFPNPNAIKMWAKSDQMHFLGGDSEMPYIQRDETFYYFGFDGKSLVLLMTSSKDLGEAQA